ncbi:MAG TPA: acyltransferase [Acidobacteriota bacterium]
MFNHKARVTRDNGIMLKSIFLNLIEDFLRNFSGSLGFALRRGYYKNRLANCGRQARIDTGVYFSNPGSISLGNNVWIDKNSHLIAGWPAIKEDSIKYKVSPTNNIERGKIIIGNNVHLGIDTIIQGHGGVSIGNNFTSSHGARIYSFSNDPYKCKSGTHHPDEKIYYVLSPVDIRDNVWLGINVIVVGNTIHNDCFIQPGSVVTSDIAPNSIAAGFPAKRIKERFEKVKG